MYAIRNGISCCDEILHKIKFKILSRDINVFGGSSPSTSTVKKQAAEHGQESVLDDTCREVATSATTPEVMDKLHNMIF